MNHRNDSQKNFAHKHFKVRNHIVFLWTSALTHLFNSNPAGRSVVTQCLSCTTTANVIGSTFRNASILQFWLDIQWWLWGKKNYTTTTKPCLTHRNMISVLFLLCAAYSPLNHNKKSIHSQTCLKLGLVLTDLQHACAGIILNREVGAGKLPALPPSECKFVQSK